MSLQQAPPSRVFVELVPWAERGREDNLVSGGETQPGLRRALPSAQAQTAAREVHVSGAAEVSAGPDRAQVAVRVSSAKEAAAEAKKSVGRRLDYITQSLQQQGVQAENVTVTKDFRRVENAYHMEAEEDVSVSATLRDPRFQHGSQQSLPVSRVTRIGSPVPPQNEQMLALVFKCTLLFLQSLAFSEKKSVAMQQHVVCCLNSSLQLCQNVHAF
nr:PREDICTED: interleukin-1 receptor-associated kinase 1-binding protein 1 isoform X2 [Equus przewalskii]